MYEIWFQDNKGQDRFVGTTQNYAQAHDIARNLINITGNNVWVEEA